jgi:hypothetical protein
VDRARRELHGSIGAVLSHGHEEREGRIIMKENQRRRQDGFLARLQ